MIDPALKQVGVLPSVSCFLIKGIHSAKGEETPIKSVLEQYIIHHGVYGRSLFLLLLIYHQILLISTLKKGVHRCFIASPCLIIIFTFFIVLLNYIILFISEYAYPEFIKLFFINN